MLFKVVVIWRLLLLFCRCLVAYVQCLLKQLNNMFIFKLDKFF